LCGRDWEIGFMSKVYVVEWKNISRDIESILDLLKVVTFESPDNGKRSESNNKILRYCKEIFRNVEQFKLTFEKKLPQHVTNLLVKFFEPDGVMEHFAAIDQPNNGRTPAEILRTVLIELSLLNQTVSYFINDPQTYLLKSVEIAFAHLQRILMADEDYASRWKKKSNGEVDFEKLGGLHFLSHKIWAFKANSEKERTDLVIQEAMNETDPLYESAEGMVLTEWKVADEKNYEKQIEAAKNQAICYKFGSLYPLELSGYCFIVIVSEKHLGLPLNRCEEIGGVKFRVINLAYNRDNPSKESAKKKSG
jgi:hypothetical protein